MNSKGVKYTLCTATLLISMIFPALTQAQNEQITFTLGNQVTVTDLSEIGGKVFDQKIASVGIFIGKAESDEEWNSKGRWAPGPTGRWLTTSRSSDGIWTPAFTLPSGDLLPNGAYNIIAVGFDGTGKVMTTQYRLTVNVSRKTKP